MLLAMTLGLLLAASHPDGRTDTLQVLVSPGGAEAAQVIVDVAQGRREVEAFFGAPFPQAVRLKIAADRPGFDAMLKTGFGMDGSECWMVGAGVADELAVLSPAAWVTQACEHRADDRAEVHRLIVHELTHVFHGQRNPTRDFAGADDIGWFVEGLAVLVSGQLDAGHRGDAARALAEGAGPRKLKTAWSGRYKYGVCGSLARFVDVTWGRTTLAALLAETTPAGVMARLGVDEAAFLARWRAWVRAGEPAAGG